MSELRIDDGPVIILETDDDPGDMGEPRIWTENGATYVAVPCYHYWPVADEAQESGSLILPESAHQTVHHDDEVA